MRKPVTMSQPPTSNPRVTLMCITVCPIDAFRMHICRARAHTLTYTSHPYACHMHMQMRACHTSAPYGIQRERERDTHTHAHKLTQPCSLGKYLAVWILCTQKVHIYLSIHPSIYLYVRRRPSVRGSVLLSLRHVTMRAHILIPLTGVSWTNVSAPY